MDIIGELGKSVHYTLHSHTQYCDGCAPMDAMARAAVAAGFTHSGFSPHSPVPIPSPCNMKAGDVPAYIAEVERIREEYPQCRFYAGMEIDFLGPQWGPHSEYFRSLPLDYSIGSVHFIPSPEGELVDIDGRFENFARKMEQYFRRDIRYVVETYFHQYLDMISLGGFDILGHMDKVAANASAWQPGIEDCEYYIALMEQAMDAAARSGKVMEINTKAYPETGRTFPALRWLEALKARGVTFIVNSDAHYPEKIDAGRPEILAML